MRKTESAVIDTELIMFFEIVTDLERAKRDDIPSIITYHLNELEAMHMHTANGHLRRRCARILEAHSPPKGAIADA